MKQTYVIVSRYGSFFQGPAGGEYMWVLEYPAARPFWTEECAIYILNFGKKNNWKLFDDASVYVDYGLATERRIP